MLKTIYSMRLYQDTPVVPPRIQKLIPEIKSAWEKYWNTPKSMTEKDWLLIAFGEALKSGAGWGRVGAILVKNGKIVGLGTSIAALRIHAEVAALKNAKSILRPEMNKGTTLYVTYQPCDFRDPGVNWKSCSEYIAESGVGSIVFAGSDPRVGDRGLKFLRDAGVKVKQIDDRQMQLLGQMVFNLRDVPVPQAKQLPGSADL